MLQRMANTGVCVCVCVCLCVCVFVCVCGWVGVGVGVIDHFGMIALHYAAAHGKHRRVFECMCM